MVYCRKPDVGLAGFGEWVAGTRHIDSTQQHNASSMPPAVALERSYVCHSICHDLDPSQVELFSTYLVLDLEYVRAW